MNKDLLLFLSRLPHDELLKLPAEDILVNYWAYAVKRWNAAHEPVHTTINDIEDAFRLLWPQIYGGINGSELYLSFSYIDYFFMGNEDGTVSGGIFKRNGEKPSIKLNMTPTQIVELAQVLRQCPNDEVALKENLDRYDKAEEYIKAYTRGEYLNVVHHMSESEALHQKAIHMEEKAAALYNIGYYEEALEWFHKSIMTKRIAGFEKNGRSFSDYAYTSMGQLYYLLLDWDMAEACFQYAYKACFKRVVDKREEDMQDAWHRFSWWASMYSNFLKNTGRTEKAKIIEDLPNSR